MHDDAMLERGRAGGSGEAGHRGSGVHAIE